MFICKSMHMADFATASRFLLPVITELICDDLAVEGEIPAALSGMYVRNGPNSRSGGSAHQFFGDGMLHAVWLEGGKALRYANRYIETSSERGLRGSVANTSVLAHAGRIFALVEVAFPREIRRDLSTVGPFDFAGKLTTPMTAHPKICPSTGELHFFGAPYAPPLPALTYHRASASGALPESQVIDVQSGTVCERQLDDLATEFPRINETHTGRGYRYGYATHFGDGNGELVKYDLVAQTFARCGFGRGRTPGEAVFVAAPGASEEDAGWLLTYVYDAERDASDFVIVNPRDLSVAATVHLPQRVPYGFHGAWINADV